MKSYNTDPMMRDVQPRSNVRVVCYNKLAVVIFREELIHLASYFQLFVDVSDRITINPNLQEISDPSDVEKMMGTMRDFSFAAPLLACMGSCIR